MKRCILFVLKKITRLNCKEEDGLILLNNYYNGLWSLCVCVCVHSAVTNRIRPPQLSCLRSEGELIH